MSRALFGCPTRADERRAVRWADQQRRPPFQLAEGSPRSAATGSLPVGAGRDRGKNAAGATLATRSLSGRLSPPPARDRRSVR